MILTDFSVQTKILTARGFFFFLWDQSQKLQPQIVADYTVYPFFLQFGHSLLKTSIF